MHIFHRSPLALVGFNFSAPAVATMPLILGPLRFTVGTVVSDTGTIYANIMALSKEKCKNLSAFGNRLKVLMEERQLTQEQVASAVGVSRAAVGTWLHGTIPGARELFILARFFEKPMESFFDAIPYIKPPAEALYDDPPGGVPVKFLSPEWRKFYAGMFEMMSTPEGSEAFKQAFRQAFEKLSPAIGSPQAADEKTSNQVLTSVSEYGKYDAMKSPMRHLLDRLSRATSERGAKTRLAAYMKVKPANISQWLSGKRVPSGETTLELLHWVEKQERQTNTLGSATNTAKRKAQVRSSKAYEKTKPSPQKH